MDGEKAQEAMSRAYRRLEQETGCELAPVGERLPKRILNRTLLKGLLKVEKQLAFYTKIMYV